MTFERLGKRQGLDADVVIALLRDRQGFLWVGSRSGLFRYDGYHAIRFQPSPDDPGSITDSDIRTLYQDRSGNLWVGTNTGGLNRFDPRTGRFTRYRNAAADPRSLSHDSVYGIAEGPDGDLWVGTQIGLNRLRREDGTFVRYRHSDTDPGSLSKDYVYPVLTGADGTLWIGTVGGGLNRWNPASSSFSSYDLAAQTRGPAGRNDVFALAEDAARNLWIGTRTGLLRLDSARVAPTQVDLVGKAVDGPAPATEPGITSLHVDNRGRLWMGTINDGIVELDPSRGRVRYHRDERPGDRALTGQVVIDLLVTQGAVFAATWRDGVQVARLPAADFRLVGLEGGDSGLRTSTVSAILADDRGPGRPWVGSFGGGPQRADLEARRFATLPGEIGPLWSAGVQQLARGADGTLWVATTVGLWELDETGRVRRRHAHDPGVRGSLGEGYVTAVLPVAGGVWVGVGGSGLHRLNEDGATFTTHRNDPADPSSLSGDYVTKLLPEGPDALWVGTRSNGLDLCKTGRFTCRRFGTDGPPELRIGHHHVTDILRDRRQRVWFGTDGGGLHQVLRDARGEVTGFRRWTRADGLVSDSVMALAEDADGSLWLSTRGGLSRLDPDLGRVASYVPQNGLPGTDFSSRAAASDERYLYFGCGEGLLAVPRGRPFEVRPPSPLRITSAGRIGNGASPAVGFAPPPDRIEIGYRDGLAIEFAVLDYAEVPHEYAFRLSPQDQWTPLGYRRELTFIGLDPGSYRLETRGRDVFGQWSQSEPLAITVSPAFWMTWWFRLFLGLVLASAVGAVYMVRVTTLRRHALEVQRLGETRERALEVALGGDAELAVLTARQKEILQLIAEGNSTRQIAERLGVSVKTVESHRSNLMERLGIHDVPGLVRLAVRARLVSPHG